MKPLLKILFSASILLSMSINIYAERDSNENTTSPKSKNKLIQPATTEDNPEITEIFKANSPEIKNVASLPNFAIVGTGKKFYIGIGANVKVSMVYDWGDVMPSVYNFIPSEITPAPPGSGAQMRFTVQPSAIFLNMVAMPNNPNKVGVFFTGNFKKEGNGFKISHLYFNYRGLKIGYTHNIFTDNKASPFVVEENGHAGRPGRKSVNLSWEQPIIKNMSFTLGIDMPNNDMQYDEYTGEVTQRLPAIQGRFGYESERSHIRISGLLKPMQYRDLIKETNRNLIGWGASVSGSYGDFAFPLCLYYGICYGVGITEYINDLNGKGMDVTPSQSDKGKLNMTPSTSWHAGASYKFSNKLSANAIYSHTKIDDLQFTNNSQDYYKEGKYITANLLYNFNKYVALILEYNFGERVSQNHTSLCVNRITCQFSIKF